jgi:uncharacterized membrane protein YsdA (DUF1294 family)
METKLLYYYAFINSLTFIVAGMDKLKSKQKKWRIRESRLHLLSFLGGAFGMVMAMISFRHKTHKTKYIVITALATAVHIAFVSCIALKIF